MRYGKPLFRRILYRGGKTHMCGVMANPKINSCTGAVRHMCGVMANPKIKSTLVKSDH